MDTTTSSSDQSVSPGETLHNVKELEALIQEIEQLENPDEKLKKTIELMELSIAQKGKPHFKVFWEAREQCLKLFKENVTPAVRAVFWEKYRDLTQQARSLKEHFEEESAFAIEQIEKAVDAIEHGLKELPELILTTSLSDFPNSCHAIADHLNDYIDIQKELNYLNAHASRINSLRKELISTKMRIRKKNKFFERLSGLGNQVFPRRKSLVEEMSNLFLDDIDVFIQRYFTPLSTEKSPHVYREEIKALQAVAKHLNLNSKVFSQTRLKLSECWDKLKELDKERKKQFEEKKEIFNVNADTIREKLKEYTEKYSTGDFSTHDAQEEMDEIFKAMRDVELGRDHVKALRDEITFAKQPLLDKLKEDEKKRHQVELQKEEQRQSNIKAVEEKTAELLKNCDKTDATALFDQLCSIEKAIDGLNLPEFEKKTMLSSLIEIENVAFEKEENDFSLPDDPKKAKKTLQDRLQVKMQRRVLIKDKLTEYRKACGGSCLDFEQSLHYNQQLNAEKVRFERINNEIRALESQLAKL